MTTVQDLPTPSLIVDLDKLDLDDAQETAVRIGR